ncbi:peptidoglycan-binding protein [Streptomyces sp. SID3212]|uniref:peptidoglycan-binding protein n=1 Tax=Streptomyces sp. SID3212 TaxID=2690259 RepID=UPI0013690651|nr:peptidoglycan-binding protein [Streptomyces sp. SID3212]MYV56497.1 N-acetylmuramoyl-L-alanine amidase [Streptomyces sp. SID3212]
MATPMTAKRFLEILLAEGLEVVQVGDWRTYNRNHKGPWGPVHGVMIHHTVTKGTATTVDICRHGYAALPGPLCHGVIAKDGRVHLVGYGRANHAGSGDDDVLQAVVDERALPADNEANTDGNRYFYGFECENLGDGKDPWPDVQLEAIEKAAAAICRFHDWGPGSVIGHLEWQPGKVDPRGFTMDSMRARVGDRLDAATPGKPKPPTRPPFPGRQFFGPGKANAYVTQLGKQLVARGYGRFYKVGPGPSWGEADRKAVAAFQASEPQLRADADGLPGPLTWHLLWA